MGDRPEAIGSRKYLSGTYRKERRILPLEGEITFDNTKKI